MAANDKILWIDCVGGIVVGCAVLAICGPLSEWENLPVSIVAGMGVANLVYGFYSLFVTLQKRRRRIFVKGLALANMGWLLICVGLTVFFWGTIAWLGVLHLVGEGVYVAGLGWVEWKWQRVLSFDANDLF